MEQFIAIATDIAQGAVPVIAFVYDYFLKFIFEDIGTILLALSVLFISAAALKASRRDARQAQNLLAHQARAQTMGAARAAWADDVRDTLAGYLSCCDTLSAMFAQNQTVNSHFLDTVRTANEYECRLTLLLDPENADHKALLDALKITAMQIANYHAVDKAPLIKSGQNVFRGAWQRVKKDANTLPVPYAPAAGKKWYKRLWQDLTE